MLALALSQFQLGYPRHTAGAGLLTKAERGNLEARDDALQRFQRIAVVSTIYVYSVKASPGKGVEAIVSVMTNKCYDNNRISSTDIHRMFLAASSVNAKEYVVLADEVISPETGRLTESYVPLYSSRRDKPPCLYKITPAESVPPGASQPQNYAVRPSIIALNAADGRMTEVAFSEGR